ncbi:MAG: alpha/beta hydrolase [Acidobacteria bacterium]|nr:alpha/beta hydrolase [Acidobacteriota bacterium]
MLKLNRTSLLPLTLVLCAVTVLGFVSQQPRNSRAILTEPPPPYDKKLAYGSDPLQFGELRLPKGDKFKPPYPVAVVIHGGCWLAEYGLGYMGHLSADLAHAGIATWNLEYRRIGDKEGAWPNTFADVAQGVDYVRTLAQTYPLDLQRVVALGHSAGGHLALLAGARQRGAATPPLSLRGVVTLAGITDLRRTGTACDAEVPKLMHGSAQENAHLYDLASPLTRLPLHLRQVIVQGDSDRIIPTAMATEYVERAKQKGDDVRLLLIEKAGHFELVDPQAAAWAQVKETVLGLVQPGK